MSRRLLCQWMVTALCLLVAGCTAAPILSRPSSYWGEIVTLGQAEQAQAPAIWVEQDRIFTAWVGADDTGIHHDIRLVPGDTPNTVLPLPPRRPYAQQLVPAQEGKVHLLWLDAGDNGETRLFGALITPESTVERGPTPISDRQTLRYTIVPNGDGSLWVIWSGTPISEPVLYAQYIDAQGRPREAQRLVEDADWPSLTYTSSGVYLYWLQTTTGQVYRARLVEGILSDHQLISPGLSLERGDRLTGFNAANDHTHGYLLWNLTRSDGRFETRFSIGPLDSAAWSEPQRLGVQWTTKSFIETAFNGGRAFPAHSGGKWLAWAAPINTQLETLPVAAMQGNSLALVYFQGGEIIGYQNMTTIAGLIGAPILLTDRDLHLYLAWSEPTPAGYADLKLTMTRR